MDSAHTCRLGCCRINAGVNTRTPGSGPSPQVSPLNSFDRADGCSTHGEFLMASPVVSPQLSPVLVPGVDLLVGAGSRPALPPRGRFADWTI